VRGTQCRSNPVRLQGARSWKVKVRLRGIPAPVVESNCVPVRAGGEQLETNYRSEGIRTRFGLAMRRACGINGEAQKTSRVKGMKARASEGGWRRNDGKGRARKQGDPRQEEYCGGSQSCRMSEEAE
jgi:hypothetical protein